MKFHDKELKDLEITLNLADGSEMTCGVFASFDVSGKTYFALQPLTPDKKPDTTQGLMLYRVEEDAEKNPVVVYIEDDNEFAAVAQEFQKLMAIR
ncbi:MAG: DUF1292 domain-containing protein [Lachnospiraceae bacterium]|nr:DUF1292 domain-containing protein [Lachnospiraceae bacterium]